MAISSLLHLACASVLLVSSTMGMPSASVQGNPDWQSALERDTHYTFTDRSASLARAALQDAKSTPQRRAAAWVAIAGAGAVAERARTRRKTAMASRRVRRGLPPEPTEQERSRRQEEDDDMDGPEMGFRGGDR